MKKILFLLSVTLGLLFSICAYAVVFDCDVDCDEQCPKDPLLGIPEPVCFSTCESYQAASCNDCDLAKLDPYYEVQKVVYEALLANGDITDESGCDNYARNHALLARTICNLWGSGPWCYASYYTEYQGLCICDELDYSNPPDPPYPPDNHFWLPSVLGLLQE